MTYILLSGGYKYMQMKPSKIQKLNKTLKNGVSLIDLSRVSSSFIRLKQERRSKILNCH